MTHSDYDHLPVGIRQFVLSPEYMDAEAECWPQVLTELEALYNAHPNSRRLSKYREAVLCKGIGSGKSFFVSMVISYGVYRLLCFKNPQRIYSLAKGSNITLLNMSKSAQQAKKIVFGEIKSRITNSPWFQKHARPDDKVGSELRFGKGVVVFPGNSQETFPLGYNVFMANMDEASFYTETDTHDVAEEMYDALDRRITSRFGRNGLLVITSSPRYEDDFTEKKMNEARLNPSTVLGIRKATWEMKPDDIVAVEAGETFEERHPKVGFPVKIPLKYEKAFRRDAKKAWRDFGAVPSLVLEQYFTDTELNTASHLMNSSTLPPMAENNQLSGRMTARAGTVYAIHIDLGLVRDACGFAIGHWDGRQVVIDGVIRIVCRDRAKELMDMGEKYDMVIGDTQVNFEEVRGLITTLIERGFAIGLVTYDQFQSVDSRQLLEAQGIRTDLLSVDRDTSAYDTLKSLLNTGRLVLPKHEHLLYELSRLEYKNGKKIDHPPNASKDCADAVAGVCKSIMEAFDEEMVEESFVEDETVRVEITPQI